MGDVPAVARMLRCCGACSVAGHSDDARGRAKQGRRRVSGMDVPKNGPTLEGVIQRLEALERENAQLRGEVATLKGEAKRKEQPDGIEGPDAVAEERVSRKAMLAKAGAAAVAVAAAGTMLSPREAKGATVEGTGNPGVRGIGTSDNSAGVRGTIQSGVVGDGVYGVGSGSTFYGVYGINNSSGGGGVRGNGDDGVQGFSERDGSSGVYGRRSNATEGYGVRGEGRGEAYAGVFGENPTGHGVWGQSSQNAYSGVFGLHQGSSGDGVFGVALGNRAGVVGECAAGAGVEGRGSRYGGKFAGSRAQLLLVPKGTTGRPRSGQHTKGEIYLDSAGTLFVCTKGGTPGTWRKVTTTSA